MKTNMTKRYLCLIVALLFLIPTVAAINNGYETETNNNNEENGMDIDRKVEFPDSKRPEFKYKDIIIPNDLKGKELSIEVQNILKKYDWNELNDDVKRFVGNHNELMLERHRNWVLENPRMPYEPLDVTDKIATMDPVTNEVTSFFPNTPLRRTEAEMCDPLNYQPNKLLADSPNTQYVSPEVAEVETKPKMSTRAPEADIELDRLEWSYVQEGWAEQNEIETDSNNNPVPGNQYSLGGFQVGKKTTFTARVSNNNPAAGSVKVYVNFSISEWFTGNPLMRNPTSYEKTVGSSPITVTLDFTPPAAGYLLIQCLVEYDNDPVTDNNYIGWLGMPVIIWSADLESGGTNYGWQKLADGSTKQHVANDWTGDKAATNAWHITSGPANQNAPHHTASNAWFHGEDVGGALVPDTYSDNEDRNIDDNNRNHTYLQTPFINMGDILDTDQVVQGLTTANTYYSDFNVMFACLITGEYEEETETNGAPIWSETDWADVIEHNDANNDNWFPEPIMGISIRGDYSTMSSILTTPRPTSWNPNGHVITDGTNFYFANGYPMRVFIADGNGGIDTRSGQVQNWTNPGVRFRVDYSGDGEDDNTGITGCYYDDFITWGIQEYTVEKRVGITDATYPVTSGVSIIYKDSTASFSVTVENFGKLYQSLPVKMTVKDMDGNQVYTDSKPAGNLANGAEKEVQFQWNPTEEGDFSIEVEVGDESEDWTPGDNIINYYVHVSPSTDTKDVDVLVVDDDNSGGQNGVWRMNTEDKMLKALTDNEILYRVYTVEYNETGPTIDVMNDYELVIWMTGLDNEIWVHGGRTNYNKNNPVWDVTLKETDIDELEAFLSGKDKKVWVISPGFMYDYYGIDYKTIPPGDFAREYLHILNCQANLTQWNNDNTEIVVQGTPALLEGVPDTVMDEAEYETYDTEPPTGFTDIGGVVEKKDPGDDDTSSLFYQDAAHLQHNSLLYKGSDHMAAFFAFNFYLIKDDADAKDCVYRLLTGFGMTGGVLIDLVSNGDRIQTVYPENSTTYQLKVENLGKKTDIMELSVKVSYPKDYPTKFKDWDPTFEGDHVKMKSGKPTVTLSSLQTRNKVYLKVTAPDADDFSEYPAEGSGVTFTIKAVSQNTKLENSTKCAAIVPVLGRITMDSSDTEENIKTEEVAKFLIELYNETNAEDDVNIELSFGGDGADLAKFVIKNNPTTNKKITVTLSANDVNDDIELHVTANEHTLAGYHNVTVYLRDESGGETFDELDFEVEVRQFYQVECNTTGDENGDKNFVINPNDYTDEGADNITKTFTINVRNWGNGYDDIKLYWEENIDSEDTSDWPEPRIYTKAGEDVDIVSVIYYDQDRSEPKYGFEEIYFDVHIPIDIEVGTYMIDFYIESDGSEAVGEEANNRVTFTFQIIKPNLIYTKLNDKAEPNFEFADFDTTEVILEDPLNEYGDYYIERSYKEFDLLVIEIKIWVTNDGDDEVELSPSDVWLNVTTEDEFGQTVYELYSNMTPVNPTSAIVIQPGEKGEFTFRWDPETLPDEEPYEYTFTVTVDPQDVIYEKDDFDNSASFELFVKHIPKPPKKSGSGGMPGFESVLMIAAFAIVIMGLMFTNRRRKH